MDVNGEDVSTEADWLVHNSPFHARVLEPADGEQVSGRFRVRVSVKGRDGQLPSRLLPVSVLLGDERLRLHYESPGVFAGYVDVGGLPDRAHALLVRVLDASGLHETVSDVLVNNVSDEGFVTRRGAQFVHQDRAFYFVGFNAYDLPFKYGRTTAAPSKTLTHVNEGQTVTNVLPVGAELTFDAQVDRTLREASRLGMTVVRTWAFNTDRADAHAFYDADWEFNEAQFRRLDNVMESARRHGMKVILTLQNYWGAYGGIAAAASRFDLSPLAFYRDERLRDMYRAYARHLVERTNTVNGRVYRDDDALFAWELMNEPRMDVHDDDSSDGSLHDPTGDRLGAWFEEEAAYIKSIDGNHMVATGSEGHGFEGWGSNLEGYGDDPLRVMNQPSIDFFTFHPYLNESWSQMTIGEARGLIVNFVRAARTLGKPVVMEEWGFNKKQPVLDLLGVLVSPDDQRFDLVRAAWYEMLASTFRREGGHGSNVWMLQNSRTDNRFGIALHTPFDDAMRDRPLALGLQAQAEDMAVLGGATFVPDVPMTHVFHGYVHEVTYRGLMPTDAHGRFWPHAWVSRFEFHNALRDLGLAPEPDHWALLPLSLSDAADVLYRGLDLSAYGTDPLAVLQRFDVLPSDERGRCLAMVPMTRGELASLLARVDDFLLYQ